MSIRRGEIWLAELNPIRGSEQAGTRPVIVFQNNIINRVSRTVLSIPLTTNLKRAKLPTCVLIERSEGGVEQGSVALCHQLRVLDKSRLLRKLGAIDNGKLVEIEAAVLFTTGSV